MRLKTKTNIYVLINSLRLLKPALGSPIELAKWNCLLAPDAVTLAKGA